MTSAPRRRLVAAPILVALAASLVGLAAAGAVPLQLTHQGRLLDADQAPLEGTHELTFRLWDAAEDGALLWEETVTESLTGGFYSAVLGADDANPLDDGIFATAPVFVELAVDDGEPLAPRQEIASVPFALRAGTAENVAGGSVDATDISVDGAVVIDGTGSWVGPTPAVDWTDVGGVPATLDAFGGLSCADGGVAKFDAAGGLWTCGTDEVLSDSEVLDVVAGAVLDLGVGSAVDGGVIATLDDLDWTLLTGVPDGFADDEDADTLATLGPTCADGDLAAWDEGAGEWTCADAGAGDACTLQTDDGEGGVAVLLCGTVEIPVRRLVSFVALSVGEHRTCGIGDDGLVRCWGELANGVGDVPTGGFSIVATDHEHACGIDDAEELVCWGNNNSGQASPPAGTFTDVCAGTNVSCGVRTTGALECWGSSGFGLTSPPGGVFSTVACAGSTACAIDTTGVITCWGNTPDGVTNPPGGTFTTLDLNWNHGCAVSTGGTMSCWGYNGYGQTSAPSGNDFLSATVGTNFSCGLRTNGSAECWGRNHHGQASPPATSLSAIDAGEAHACGLTEAAATATCWGLNSAGQLQSP